MESYRHVFISHLPRSLDRISFKDYLPVYDNPMYFGVPPAERPWTLITEEVPSSIVIDDSDELEPGYYWIRLRENWPWEVAKYDPYGTACQSCGPWTRVGDLVEYQTSDIFCVGPYVEQPEGLMDPSLVRE